MTESTPRRPSVGCGPPLLVGEGWYRESPGGLNRYLSELLGALRRRGVDARAVVLGPALGAPPGVDVGGRSTEMLPLRLWRHARAITRGIDQGAALIDAHFALYAWWPVVAGRARDLPLVVHFQGPWAAESRTVGHSLPRVGVKRLASSARSKRPESYRATR